MVAYLLITALLILLLILITVKVDGVVTIEDLTGIVVVSFLTPFGLIILAGYLFKHIGEKFDLVKDRVVFKRKDFD